MITIPEDCRTLNKGSDENSNVLYIQVLEKIRLWILKGYIKDAEHITRQQMPQASNYGHHIALCHYLRQYTRSLHTVAHMNRRAG